MAGGLAHGSRHDMKGKQCSALGGNLTHLHRTYHPPPLKLANTKWICPKSGSLHGICFVGPSLAQIASKSGCSTFRGHSKTRPGPCSGYIRRVCGCQRRAAEAPDPSVGWFIPFAGFRLDCEVDLFHAPKSPSTEFIGKCESRTLVVYS